MQEVTNFPDSIWICFFPVSGSVSQVTMKSSWRARALTSSSGNKSMTGFTGLFFLLFCSGIQENSAVDAIRISAPVPAGDLFLGKTPGFTRLRITGLSLFEERKPGFFTGFTGSVEMPVDDDDRYRLFASGTLCFLDKLLSRGLHIFVICKDNFCNPLFFNKVVQAA